MGALSEMALRSGFPDASIYLLPRNRHFRREFWKILAFFPDSLLSRLMASLMPELRSFERGSMWSQPHEPVGKLRYARDLRCGPGFRKSRRDDAAGAFKRARAELG
jgi:hypothetical protein